MPDNVDRQNVQHEVILVGYGASRQTFASLDDAVLYAHSLLEPRVVQEVRIRTALTVPK